MSLPGMVLVLVMLMSMLRGREDEGVESGGVKG